jgi:CDP-diacylglycerol--serine O-phosphatidyltransferase
VRFGLGRERSYSVRLALVTALTLANALCGFAGIVALVLGGADGVFFAVVATFTAWFFDVCDGLAAARLGVVSASGALLDSLADAVSFGVLPALLVIVAARELSAGAVLVVAAVYLGAVLLRLGRYTAQAVAAPAGTLRLWFSGVPSPVAGMSVAALVLAGAPAWAILTMAGLTAPLMLAALRYSDLVRAYGFRRIPPWTLVVPLAACALVDPRRVLAAFFIAYLLSGAAIALVDRRGRVLP